MEIYNRNSGKKYESNTCRLYITSKIRFGAGDVIRTKAKNLSNLFDSFDRRLSENRIIICCGEAILAKFTDYFR